MKEILKMAFALTIICIVAAASLQFVYSKTKPVIDKNIRTAAEKKRQKVLPEAVAFVEKSHEQETYFIGTRNDEKNIGIVKEIAPKGYGGPIRTTVGHNLDCSINDVAINKLDQTETPGLGVKVTSENFLSIFRGKKGDSLKLKKDGGTVDAITSATISSRAVANGVLNSYNWCIENKEHIFTENNERK